MINKLLTFVFIALLGCASPALAQFPQQAPNVSVAGGSSNAITLTIPNVTSLQNLKGVVLTFFPIGTNSGPTTVNVNSLGAVALKRGTSSGILALAGGELVNAVPTQIYYTGTEFMIVSPILPAGITPPVVVRGAGADRRLGTNSFTVPADVNWIYITVVGGGGGADVYTGNVEATEGSIIVYVTSGSGGGGGTASNWFAVTPGQTLTYSVGGGGGPGQFGTDTTFSFLTGQGGHNASGFGSGVGGEGLGGQINIAGSNGQTGQYTARTFGNPGTVIAGGTSAYGRIGQGAYSIADPLYTPRGETGGIFFTW